MIHPFSTRYFESLVAFSLALATLPALEAQPRCPGNTASVTPRFVQRALIVIPVKINHAGPFDFIVDTGSQVTVIDPSLAFELSLNSQGRVALSPLPAMPRRPQLFWIRWKQTPSWSRNHLP
jgi:Aspartyl protease